MLAVGLAVCCKRPIPKILCIERIRTNRDILREADARHCQPPGAWRIVVHHDLSPFDPNASFKSVGRLDRVCPRKCPCVLGIDLNRSESELLPRLSVTLNYDAGPRVTRNGGGRW
jgi:hypothetical protein